MIDDLILSVIGDVAFAWSVVDWAPSFSTGDPPELQRVYESASEALVSDRSNIGAYFVRGVVCQSSTRSGVSYRTLTT